MRTDDYEDYEVVYKFATKDAILVAQNNEEHWIPRSVLDYSTDKKIGDNYFGKDQDIKIRLREWFADKIGLR